MILIENAVYDMARLQDWHRGWEKSYGEVGSAKYAPNLLKGSGEEGTLARCGLLEPILCVRAISVATPAMTSICTRCHC